MEKYKNYLENKYKVWQIVMSILAAVAMLIFICVEMCVPIDSPELEAHFEQLEMLKQDTANISELENATIDINADGMTVTIKGKTNDLKAVFDTEHNYVNAEIVDNRVGSNLLISIFAIIIAFGYGYILSFAVLTILYIPVGIYYVVRYLKNKIKYRKKKQET